MLVQVIAAAVRGLVCPVAR